ncbi:MAG: DMT family transporter [Pseudomonadota bacterium]
MHERLLAPLSIVVGMLVLAISDNFIWMVSDLMSVWQYHAVRAALLLPGMALVIWAMGKAGTIRPKRPGAVFARAVFSVGALMLYFTAIPAVGVSLAAAGLFTSPIFVILISVFAYGDRVGISQVLAVLIGFVGVCLVLKVGQQPLRPVALAPMAGGFLYALNVIWTRRYCRQESPGALAFWNMAFFLVIGGLGLAATPWLGGVLAGIEGTDFATMPAAPMGQHALLIIFAMGVCGAIGMVCLAYGYSGAPSSYAALFDYSFLVWVPLFAWVLWGEVLSVSTALGMALIIAAGCLGMLGGQRAQTRGA